MNASRELEIRNDENTPLRGKSIGRGVVQQVGADFLLKLIHFNHLYPILGLLVTPEPVEAICCPK